MMQVMERLDNALFNMEEPDTMRTILLETGAYHRRIQGLRSEMFKVGIAGGERVPPLPLGWYKYYCCYHY